MGRSRSRPTAADRRASRPPATAWSASSRGSAWCRRNTRRTVRQHLLHHADDAHGDGHCADAGRHGRAATRATRSPSAGRSPGFAAAARAGALKGVRIAWRAGLGNKQVAAEVLTACEAAAGGVRRLGAEVTESTAPFENPRRCGSSIMARYRMAQFGHHLQQHRDIMCPTFVRQMDRVRTTRRPNCTTRSSSARDSTGRCRPGSTAATSIAMPTLSRTRRADRPGLLRPDRDRQPAGRRTSAPPGIPTPCRSTSPATPRSACPAASTARECRLAIQLVARPGADAELLRMAAAFEAARPWRQHRALRKASHCPGLIGPWARTPWLESGPQAPTSSACSAGSIRSLSQALQETRVAQRARQRRQRRQMLDCRCRAGSAAESPDRPGGRRSRRSRSAGPAGANSANGAAILPAAHAAAQSLGPARSSRAPRAPAAPRRSRGVPQPSAAAARRASSRSSCALSATRSPTTTCIRRR